ncbi:MAG: hypothetical protein ACREX9_03605 [Gammaproteobacteria bacterium]
MKHSGPRTVSPREGLDWLRQAFLLLLRRPGLFIATALLAPLGSTVFLNLFELGPLSGWFSVVAAVACYGLPVSIVVPLACALARAVNRERVPSTRQLLSFSALRVLGRTGLFIFALLLQAYLTAYLLKDIIRPATFASGVAPVSGAGSFGMFDSVLGAQLGTLGGLLLVFQLLFCAFVIPLHLFSERPFYHCWRLSFLAMQLNPWLWPPLGLAGLLLILLPSVPLLDSVAQVLALPLPVYVGALLYIAWLEIFQGGEEEPIALDSQAEEEGDYSFS